MTTEELLKECEEIAELNRQRRQGQYSVVGKDSIYVNYGQPDQSPICDMSFHYHGKYTDNDRDFLVAAPRMAGLIAKLAEELHLRTKCSTYAERNDCRLHQPYIETLLRRNKELADKVRELSE